MQLSPSYGAAAAVRQNVKYSKSFERDYKFYSRNLDVFSFSGKPAPEIVVSPDDGLDAKECFYLYDSTGQLKPCVRPELLQRLLVCKASVNLHVKLWAMGIQQGVLDLPELGRYLHSIGAPAWVLRAVAGQLS